jgi:hypothetical protein
LFSFLKRRRNLRVALSTKESFAARNAAIHGLADAADAAAIGALYRIAAGPDDVNLRRTATSRLASVSSPASLRVLLDLLAAESTSNSWVFMDACSGLSWNTITLRKLADEAVPPLSKAGSNVLAWKRGTAGERAVQAKALHDVAEILEKLATPAARSARAELSDVLQRQRAKELPGLVKIALESGAFDEAESAIAEIAELGTPDGLAALTKIRKQPVRYLDRLP